MAGMMKNMLQRPRSTNRRDWRHRGGERGALIHRAPARPKAHTSRRLVQSADGRRGGGHKQSLRGGMRGPLELEACNARYAEGARCPYRTDRGAPRPQLPLEWLTKARTAVSHQSVP